jgi:hypothetical protein
MNRIFLSIILAAITVFLGLISDGFGDVTCTLQTWLGSFILPFWSLFTISLWYDVGRLLWVKTFEVDTEKSKVSNDLRSLIFILWMSIVLTYVVWVHISLFAIPLLLVIPFLGIPFRNHMIQDWSVKPVFTREQVLALTFWASTSYLVYWLLTIGWILIRVWAVDTFDNGIVYFIQ